MPPLFVIEFLHRVVDTFTEYFNSCNETSIKEHVVVVFEVRINYDMMNTVLEVQFCVNHTFYMYAHVPINSFFLQN